MMKSKERQMKIMVRIRMNESILGKKKIKKSSIYPSFFLFFFVNLFDCLILTKMTKIPKRIDLTEEM